MKARRRKPTAAQQAVIDMAIASIAPSIQALQTPEQAELLESYIWKFRTAGQISDQQYQAYLNDINQIYKENNWVKPIT